jgi:hypothetical protein
MILQLLSCPLFCRQKEDQKGKTKTDQRDRADFYKLKAPANNASLNLG